MRGERKKNRRCPPRQPGGNGPAAGEAQGRDPHARRGWEPGGGDRAAAAGWRRSGGAVPPRSCVCARKPVSGLCRWDPFGEVGVGLKGAGGRGRAEGRVTSRSLSEPGGPRRPPAGLRLGPQRSTRIQRPLRPGHPVVVAPSPGKGLDASLRRENVPLWPAYDKSSQNPIFSPGPHF